MQILCMNTASVAALKKRHLENVGRSKERVSGAMDRKEKINGAKSQHISISVRVATRLSGFIDQPLKLSRPKLMTKAQES
jgi:hypothetical protein